MNKDKMFMFYVLLQSVCSIIGAVVVKVGSLKGLPGAI